MRTYAFGKISILNNNTMSQKSSFIAIGIIAVLIAGMVWWGVSDSRNKTADFAQTDAALLGTMVYYYGAECPHCQRIQEFLDADKVADTVTYEKKEVWHDAKNSAELSRRAQSVCNLDPGKLGVPFVITDGKCYSGETEVTDIFKQKAGIR
jgi:glutaredoxin